MSNIKLLELKELKKEFGSEKNRVIALNNINLSINQGEMVAIIGPSGSGKSTLLNILGLLEKPTHGEYEIEGKNVKNFSDKELAKYRNDFFGFVVQHFALIKDLSVYDNIEIPLQYAKVRKKESKQLILEKLEKLGISDKINSMAKELSGGEAQRVAIARAIINSPKVILADEPTGALDSKTEQDIINIFKSLNKEGKTIIIITHDESVANQCDRIIKIVDGDIIQV